MAALKTIKALNSALDEEMRRDERVCLFGEDIGAFGGVWGLAVGLQKKYGKRRVFDTPLSESAIIGTAVGAAIAGLRPVAELQYVDFVTECMDPLMNQGAKLRFMSGGRMKVPMTIVAPCGAGTSEAAHHSKSLESWFLHEPGMKVIMPSTVPDLKGLLKSAIRDDNPAILLWHKAMFEVAEEVADDEGAIPLGKAIVRRQGTEVTLVAYSLMARKAVEAADRLQGRVSVAVVDPRTLNPFDLQAVLDSVRKTGRLLVAHESPARCGVGSDIIRQVVSEAFTTLKTAPKLLAGADLPVPFAKPLETACIPQVDDIERAILSLVEN
ncbi:MAG: alpha-ketoacid dehydrogenase subunit beta [Acidobacteriaceae bacterium]|nr:alpha-ketoacid dehydrogenase subunit beta [Acidobacteriaceae bacterium]